MLTGVLYGLAAATFQSLSYLFTRWFVTRHARGVVSLLVAGHIVMGAMALTALAFLFPTTMPPLRSYFPSLALTSLFYLTGQAIVTVTLQRTAASRLAPLLGLKVFILAVSGVLFFDASLSGPQWAAVVMSGTAAVLLSRLGGAIPPSAIGGILVASVSYSLSDINVRRLVLHFGDLNRAHATALSVCLTYVSVGLAALPGLAFRYKRRVWLDAVPYAVSWFFGMFFLFGTFAAIGVVYGNIVQSIRGLISIALGAMVARWGFVSVEEEVGTATIVRRGLAAVLMTAAIALFYMGS